LALWEALKRADKAGGLSGENILKKGFETMQDHNIGLNVPPLTYTATDHRVAGKVPIYEIVGGKIKLLKIVDLKSRWSAEWANEWIGW
jgi:branched-chain amino acid transport system substrate-binding protein